MRVPFCSCMSKAKYTIYEDYSILEAIGTRREGEPLNSMFRELEKRIPARTFEVIKSLYHSYLKNHDIA